jgi:hypothetical protein
LIIGGVDSKSIPATDIVDCNFIKAAEGFE